MAKDLSSLGTGGVICTNDKGCQERQGQREEDQALRSSADGGEAVAQAS